MAFQNAMEKLSFGQHFIEDDISEYSFTRRLQSRHKRHICTANVNYNFKHVQMLSAGR